MSKVKYLSVRISQLNWDMELSLNLGMEKDLEVGPAVRQYVNLRDIRREGYAEQNLESKFEMIQISDQNEKGRLPINFLAVRLMMLNTSHSPIFIHGRSHLVNKIRNLTSLDCPVNLPLFSH